MTYDYRNWGKDCLKKSAHELLVMAQDLLYTGVKGHSRSSVLLPELEAALRSAVIREASVGVVKLSHNGVASDYDIVPKETP